MAGDREVDTEEPGCMAIVREIARGNRTLLRGDTEWVDDGIDASSCWANSTRSSAGLRRRGARGRGATRRAGALGLHAGFRRHRAGDQGAHCRPLDPC